MIGVNDLLIVHRRVDGGHGARFDAEGVVQQLDHRDNAVGGAGSVGDDAIGLFKSLFVHAEHHGGVEIAAAWMGEEHLLGARLQMRLAVRPAAVNAGALQHHVDVKLAPRQRVDSGVMQNADSIVAHPQQIALLTHVEGEAAVAGVVLQQVRHAGRLRQFVNRHHGNFGATPGLIEGAQYVAPNAAKAIYRHPNGHLFCHFLLINVPIA